MIERRFQHSSQSPLTATKRDAGLTTIAGYAAVFYREGNPGTEYTLWDEVVERIRPGAFDRALRERHDVRALYNHDPDNLLGRTRGGTCRLSVDKIGLRYEIDVDMEDPDCARVVAKINRGDLSGSSFAFIATKAAWEDFGDRSVRWIEDVNLFDVGPVTYPAYGSTTADLRDEELEFLKTQREDWLAIQRAKLALLR